MNFSYVLSSKDTQAFIFEEGEDGLVAEKQVVYVGRFHPDGTPEDWFDVTENHIDHWVSTQDEFNSQGIEVPLPEEHKFDPSSRQGTVLALSKRLDVKNRISLFAKVRFKDMEAKKLFSEAQVSLHSPPEYSVNGKTYRQPITHIALTDYPVVPDLGTWRTISASNKPVKLTPTTPKTTDNKMKSLMTALGLEVHDAMSDDQMTDAIAAKFSLVVKENGDLKNTVTDLQKKIDSGRPATDTPAPIAPGILSMARDSRSMKLDKLVSAGNITPAVADALKTQYTTDATLSFSLNAADGKADGFDSVVEALAKNDVVDLKEVTGAQLSFSTDAKDTESDNTVTRLAKAKAEAAG